MSHCSWLKAVEWGFRRGRFGVLTALAAVVFLGSGPPAHADLTITPTFTANFVADFGGNAAAAEASWEAAAAVYTSTFSASAAVQHANINITVDAVAGTSVFGESNYFLRSISYTALQAAVAANAAKSGNPDQLASVAPGGSLSTTNPDTSATYWLNTAQAKALGLTSSTGTDGTTTFGAGNPFYFGTGTPPAGQYYFEGIALHEIAEVMGRQGLKSGTIGGHQDSHSLLDLFAYTGHGARSLTNGNGAFFSIDNGTTLLMQYNPNTLNGLDSRDWATTSPYTPDAYNQFSDSGVINGFTGVDLREMNVLGYDLPPVTTIPEPSSMLVAAVGALGLSAYGWRRRRKQRAEESVA
jgi:hypothetical protein